MTPPAVAPAPESDYELMLPEGVTVEALSASLAEPPAAVPPEEAPALSPAVAPAPAPAPAPVAAAPAPAVAPAPAPARPGVVRDLQKERGRRQNAERLATTLELENQRLRADARDRADAAAARPVEVAWTPQELAQLKHEAQAKVGDFADPSKFGDAVEVIATAVTNKFNAASRAAAASRPTPQAGRQAEAARLEVAFRHDNPDYDERLTKAGIWRAMAIDPATGIYVEPATVRAIQGADNPAAMAYEIATGRLSTRGELPTEAEADAAASPPVAPAPAPVAAAAPAPTAAAPAPAAAPAAPAPPATPRDQAAERGMGIRRIPGTGGAPKAAMSREGLTRLMHNNYEAYLKLLEANPGLEEYHTEGIPYQGAVG